MLTLIKQEMKYPIQVAHFTIFIFVFIIVSSCDQNNTDYQTQKKELLALETEAIKHEFRNDTAFLSGLMDSTFIELTPNGVKRKHAVLATIYNNNISNQDNQISLDSFTLDEPIVHLYGDAAVVTFIMHTYRKKVDSLFERRTRFYDVWVKRNNEWKAVTWQASPIE